MIRNRKKHSLAFSLIELLVAVAIFSLTIVIIAQITKFLVDAQRSTMANQNTQENMRYVFTVFSQELRNAERNQGFCREVNPNRVFKVSSDGQILSFRNRQGECVDYYVVNDNGVFRLVISRNGVADYLTSRKVNIQSLYFVVDESSAVEPLITFKITAQAYGSSYESATIQLQSTISARYSNN